MTKTRKTQPPLSVLRRLFHLGPARKPSKSQYQVQSSSDPASMSLIHSSSPLPSQALHPALRSTDTHYVPSSVRVPRDDGYLRLTVSAFVTERPARTRATAPSYEPQLSLAHKARLTPSLPDVWTSEHDRAICILDALDYAIPRTIRKMYHTYPELTAFIITPAMIDVRLRYLDQIPEIDYFKQALEYAKRRRANQISGDASDKSSTAASSLLDGRNARSPLVAPVNRWPKPVNGLSMNHVQASRGDTALYRINERRGDDEEDVDELIRTPLNRLSPNLPLAKHNVSPSKSVSSMPIGVNTVPFEGGFMSMTARNEDERPVVTGADRK